MLQSGFYVDNLQYTGDDVNLMVAMYGEAFSRMLKGGFELRSWYSNNPVLQKTFQKDERATEHDKSCEKFLGFLYDSKRDEMSLSQVGTSDRDVYCVHQTNNPF